MIQLTPTKKKELQQLIRDKILIRIVVKVYTWTNAGLRNSKRHMHILT